MPLSGSVNSSAGALGGQGILELQEVKGPLTEVLGVALGHSAGGVSALHCRAVSPAF